MPSRSLPFSAIPARDLRDGVSVRTLSAVLARRRRLFWLPVVVLTLVGIAVAMLLPSRYVAYALLAIEPVSLAEESPATPAALTAEQQLPQIAEIVQDRTLLEKVAAEFGLFPESGGRLDERRLVELRGHVRTRSAGPSTFTIGYEDGDPVRAAAVARRLAELLVDTHRAGREARARDTAGFIESQLGTLREGMAKQEREIETYKRTWFVELPEQVPGTFAQLERTDRRLQEVEASIAGERVRAISLDQEMRALDRQGYAKEPADARVDALRLELEGLRRRYTPIHPDVVRKQAELEELEGAIRDGRAAAVAATQAPSPAQLRRLQIAGELEAARTRVAAGEAERRMLLAEKSELLRRMESAPKHEAELAGMARGYDGAKLQHEALLEQLDEAHLAERLETARRGIYRLLEEPRVPTSPSSPRRARILLLGLLAGIAAGLAAALLAEQSDTSFRDVADFRAPSSLPVLAAVPWQPSRPRLLGSGGPDNPPVALLDEPFGPAAEQYRILAAKLVARAASTKAMSVLVTSSQPGEGKSTAAANLAIALSRMLTDSTILLVDADPGRPAIHRLMDLPPGPGLAALLERPDDDPARYVRIRHGLFVLDAGEFTQASRDALGSGVGERVFERLRRRFACVVVDAPPVLAVAEGMLLQKLVDSTVLVVRARVTPREWLRQAMENVDFSRLAGVLLTDVDGRPLAYPHAGYGPAESKVTA